MRDRQMKIQDELKKLAATFFEMESNATSLLTITKCEVSPDLKRAIVFLTVLPESKEKSALAFAIRNRTEFTDYMKKNSRLPRIPYIDIKIDEGEKNRQRIDDLLAQQ